MSNQLIDEETLERPSSLLPMRWRAHLFDKAGKCYRSISTFDSEADCLARIDFLIEWMRNTPPAALETLNGRILDKDYSWHMAIPELL